MTPQSADLPIKYGEFFAPFLDVTIESKSYPLYLDTGFSSQLSLSKEILDKIDKWPYKQIEYYDYKGQSYTTPAYLIEQVVFKDFHLRDVIVREENLDFHENTSFSIPVEARNPFGLSKQIGSIGFSLLRRCNLFLDFPGSKARFTNRIAEVVSKKEEWICLPIDLNPWGICLVKTDWGEKRFLVDTGATFTFIRPSSFEGGVWEKDAYDIPYLSTGWMMGGRDFGKRKMYALEISPNLSQIDGILGMDFLKDFAIYLDFREKKLWIKTVDLNKKGAENLSVNE